MINIYRASAGSGKTHKLTGEYIKLLFGRPYAYKYILAVTFTNKATDEMKQRILQELYNLASPERRSGYLAGLMEIHKKDEAWVRREAGKILVSILHDYSSFSISTIDRFFQMIMRAFAREMGKIATYNVELDKEGVLSNAIDMMFAELDKPENGNLLRWLIDYSLEAVDAGNSWNIRKDIFDLAKELFSEDFKLKKREFPVEGEESSRGEIILLKGKIKKITEDFERELIRLGREGAECMARCGTSFTGFKGGSRSPFRYFNVLAGTSPGTRAEKPKDSFTALYDNKENWYSGKSIPAVVAAAWDGGLNECIGKIISHFGKGYRRYATALAIKNNMNALGILDDIYRRVLAYCREKNIMLLSESTELLNRIIDGSDTPFVYEKIGARIDNFMLDEFQDTSVLQWRNFYPLLQNSLAEGNDNLIVGDVKQSIYRWRGSDWKILNGGLSGDFREDQINNYSLDCNWRSGKHIVDFNNGFFKFCALQAQRIYNEKSVGSGAGGVIEGIYSGFEQHVSAKGAGNPGYVEINFTEPGEEGFEADVLLQLPERIKDLLRNGAAQKDIAVLVRTKEQGRNAARALINAGVDVISNDSLFVCASFAVQKTVNILREMDNPANPSLKIYRHFSSAGFRGAASVNSVDAGDGKIYDGEAAERIAGVSLYQMCEEIIRSCLSGEEKEELAFLQSFLDSALEYSYKEGSDLSGFLKWWDECGQLKTISAPEDQDAVNVMTIHKSKGLGFGIVIIPFLKENLDRTGGRLWCNLPECGDMPDECGLDFAAPLPVTYNSFLSETDFSADYYNEKLCTFVDNLNTAYVAFTRPREQLIIYSPVPRFNKNGDYTVTSVADILYMYYQDMPSGAVEDNPAGNIRRIFTGSPGICRKEQETFSRDLIVSVFDSPADYSRIKTSLSSGSVNEETSIREYGIAMHYVFSMISTPADIPAAAGRAFEEGVSSRPPEELADLVMRKLETVACYGWFDEENTVLNECDIIRPDGSVVRPDRVIIKKDGSAIVIDYKFGGHGMEVAPERRYINQVKEYMELLGKIGYERVEGYLWYVESGEVSAC